MVEAAEHFKFTILTTWTLLPPNVPDEKRKDKNADLFSQILVQRTNTNSGGNVLWPHTRSEAFLNHSCNDFEKKFLRNSEYALIILSGQLSSCLDCIYPRFLVFFTLKPSLRNRILIVFLGKPVDENQFNTPLITHSPIIFEDTAENQWKNDVAAWKRLFKIINLNYRTKTVENPKILRPKTNSISVTDLRGNLMAVTFSDSVCQTEEFHDSTDKRMNNSCHDFPSSLIGQELNQSPIMTSSACDTIYSSPNDLHYKSHNHYQSELQYNRSRHFSCINFDELYNQSACAHQTTQYPNQHRFVNNENVEHNDNNNNNVNDDVHNQCRSPETDIELDSFTGSEDCQMCWLSSCGLGDRKKQSNYPFKATSFKNINEVDDDHMNNDAEVSENEISCDQQHQKPAKRYFGRRSKSKDSESVKQPKLKKLFRPGKHKSVCMKSDINFNENQSINSLGQTIDTLKKLSVSMLTPNLDQTSNISPSSSSNFSSFKSENTKLLRNQSPLDPYIDPSTEESICDRTLLHPHQLPRQTITPMSASLTRCNAQQKQNKNKTDNIMTHTNVTTPYWSGNQLNVHSSPNISAGGLNDSGRWSMSDSELDTIILPWILNNNSVGSHIKYDINKSDDMNLYNNSMIQPTSKHKLFKLPPRYEKHSPKPIHTTTNKTVPTISDRDRSVVLCSASAEYIYDKHQLIDRFTSYEPNEQIDKYCNQSAVKYIMNESIDTNPQVLLDKAQNDLNSLLMTTQSILGNSQQYIEASISMKTYVSSDPIVSNFRTDKNFVNEASYSDLDCLIENLQTDSDKLVNNSNLFQTDFMNEHSSSSPKRMSTDSITNELDECNQSGKVCPLNQNSINVTDLIVDNENSTNTSTNDLTKPVANHNPIVQNHILQTSDGVRCEDKMVKHLEYLDQKTAKFTDLNDQTNISPPSWSSPVPLRRQTSPLILIRRPSSTLIPPRRSSAAAAVIPPRRPSSSITVFKFISSDQRSDSSNFHFTIDENNNSALMINQQIDETRLENQSKYKTSQLIDEDSDENIDDMNQIVPYNRSSQLAVQTFGYLTDIFNIVTLYIPRHALWLYSAVFTNSREEFHRVLDGQVLPSRQSELNSTTTLSGLFIGCGLAAVVIIVRTWPTAIEQLRPTGEMLLSNPVYYFERPLLYYANYLMQSMPSTMPWSRRIIIRQNQRRPSLYNIRPLT